jgi:hypothetical protein
MTFKDLIKRFSTLAEKHLDFLSRAFSDNGTPSSSRVLTAFHSAAAIFVLTYIAVKSQKYPGVDEATGLGGFAVVHYGVNRVSGMFGGQKKDKANQNVDPAQDKQDNQNLEVKK